jgi:rhamnosyltransferase subunit B
METASLPLPPEVSAFLEKNPSPLLWTHGSANHDTARFHRCAIRTSEMLGLPFLIVGPEEPREPLPATGISMRHLRFEDIFPCCRAIIHHGGIGTTAKAIAAGRPQLVIPRAHDQPDNAARVSRLGLGFGLPFGSCNPKLVASTLRRLLASEVIAARCREYSPLVRDGADAPGFVAFVESLKKNDPSACLT